jgi:hypothetical protein
LRFDETDQRLPDDHAANRRGPFGNLAEAARMNEIFAPLPTIKRRALEMLLTLVIVAIGLVCTSELNSVGMSLVGGLLTAFLMIYLSERFWPGKGDAPDRRQWALFFVTLVIPCGIVAGGLLIYTIYQHNSTDTYFAALLLGCVICAPVQLRRVPKRVP